MRISFLSEVPESVLAALPPQEIDRLDLMLDDIDATSSLDLDGDDDFDVRGGFDS